MQKECALQKTERSKWLQHAARWPLPCQLGSEYFHISHINYCIIMFLSLRWCDIIAVSVFFFLWCLDGDKHSPANTRAMTHICKVFLNLAECPKRAIQKISITLTLSPDSFSLSTAFASVCVWQGAGPLSPGRSVHLLVISYEAAIKPLTSAGFWALSYPSRVSHLLC